MLLYVFALSFLSLCGYVYLLAQLRQREASGWGDGWLESALIDHVDLAAPTRNVGRYTPRSLWGYSSVGRARRSQ